jgi:general secretion pathway protein E
MERSGSASVLPVKGGAAPARPAGEPARALAARLGLPYLAPDAYPEEPLVGPTIAVKFLRRYCCLPLASEAGRLTVAMADPADAETLEALRSWTGLDPVPVVGEEAGILEAIERLYGSGSTTVQNIIDDMGGGEVEVIAGPAEEDADHLRDMASEAPVIRLVNLLITRAAEAGASDIHFEPFEDRLIVRYRIDGVLHEVESPSKRLQAAIISRVKLMAKMNIAERRLPQDGRISVRVGEHGIDIRVSTVPTVFGESLVLRLLDRSHVLLDLATLGFAGHDFERFERLIARPYGMILVTGPTGSGKTTTLYAVLDRLNAPDKKIVTIEDPVEYQLTGINQIQVHPKIGLTFAGGLRSIVRQDPDVILVGEIRDRETADIAIQSALTGHLVFSTVHTNDAAGAVTRLEDMGVESFLIASAVIGIMAQRLVRRVCPECAAPAPPDPALLRSLGADSDDTAGYRAGTGCEACNRTGFRGRLGIFELLPITDEIRGLVLARASAGAIRDAAVRAGMRTMRRDGLDKAAEGRTTPAEVMRVTQEE